MCLFRELGTIRIKNPHDFQKPLVYYDLASTKYGLVTVNLNT